MGLGWEARYNFGDTFSLVAPLHLRFSTLRDAGDDRVKTTRAIGGMGIALRINDRKLSSERFDGLMWERLEARPDNSGARWDRGRERDPPLDVVCGEAIIEFKGC